MAIALEIKEHILSAKNIVITSHKGPDGDSIGSSLGMLRIIRALGKEAQICHPDPCPSFLEWTKEGDEIIDMENSPERVTELMQNADLIFSLDYNGIGRIGRDMAPLLEAAAGKKIMIDHHLDPEDFADVMISRPEVCSTSQLVIEWLEEIDKSLMNESIAAPLYLGMMTDTGSFRFPSVTAKTHELLAWLLASGLNHARVHEETFDNNRVDRLKLRGFAISEKLELIPEHKAAIISLTAEELERFNFIKGDTEGLVNVALSIEGVSLAVFMSEKEGKIKMSFRSVGDIPANQIAGDHFDGGGHKNAAGGISDLSMNETIEKVKKVIPSYV